MAGLFYHDVLTALTGAGVPFVIVKTDTGRAQDDSDVEALRRVEALRGR